MTAIDDFLAQKDLSENSQAAYRYDLEQFRQHVSGELNAHQLKAYQLFLNQLKPRVQKRKLSTVNQFLYYLYQTGQIKDFYKLKVAAQLPLPEESYQIIDLSRLTEQWKEKEGQLIALLIAHLGLQPSELMQLESSALDLDFQVMTVKRGRNRRLLELPERLIPFLQERLKGNYLFDKSGETYSRQWFFSRLHVFLTEAGLSELNAQKLRDQYILRQLAAGLDLSQIAKNLGLKSTITLEKYIKNGYKN